MMDVFLRLSSILTGAVRVLVGLTLVHRLLSIKRPDRKSIAAGLAGALVLTVLLSLLRAPDFYRMALEAVLIAACAHRLQGAELRMGLFVGIFYEIGVSFWSFLLPAWLGVLFRSQDFLNTGTLAGQSALWLLHGLLAVLAACLSRDREINHKSAFRAVSALTLAGFLGVITLSEQTVLAIPDDTLYMWTILAVVLMMSVLVFNINRQYEVEKELAKLKSEQAELLERDYTAVNRAYQVNARLFHDLHNHIGVLRQFLTHEKYGEAVRYLDELQAPVQNLTANLWTGDETADYLINSKAAMAEDCGIRQIALENHGMQLVYSPETLLRLRDAVGPMVGMNLDPSHLFWMGGDPIEAARVLGAHGALYHVHGKDSRPERRMSGPNGMLDTKPIEDFRRRAWNYVAVGAGHGVQWWKEFFSVLRMEGYDGPISLEMEDLTLSMLDGHLSSIRVLKEALTL